MHRISARHRKRNFDQIAAIILLAVGRKSERRTVVIKGPKVLDFYAGFCAHRATCLKADGKDITDLKLILDNDPKAKNDVNHLER